MFASKFSERHCIPKGAGLEVDLPTFLLVGESGVFQQVLWETYFPEMAEVKYIVCMYTSVYVCMCV